MTISSIADRVVEMTPCLATEWRTNNCPDALGRTCPMCALRDALRAQLDEANARIVKLEAVREAVCNYLPRGDDDDLRQLDAALAALEETS